MDVSPAAAESVELSTSGERSLTATLCAGHLTSPRQKLARDIRAQEGSRDV